MKMFANESYPSSWQDHQFQAMGCEMAVWLEAADQAAAEAAFAQVEALFAANEQALSRFRPDSELSQLNAKSGQWVVVSDLLWDVLTLALEMAAITNGRYDPTILNAMEQTGYTVSFEKLDRSGHNDHFQFTVPTVGQWTAVNMNEARQAVLLPAGIRIDLGGIAKGYTAQQAVDLLRSWGPSLVVAGGDLAAGAAPRGYPGWPVAISAPWIDDAHEPSDLVMLWLAEAALATSGIDYRTWTQNGRSVHHLIDPITGQPAVTDGLTATILMEDAAEAEAWATATLITGSIGGMEALSDVDLAGLMVTRNGRVLLTPSMHQHLQLMPV